MEEFISSFHACFGDYLTQESCDNSEILSDTHLDSSESSRLSLCDAAFLEKKDSRSQWITVRKNGQSIHWMKGSKFSRFSRKVVRQRLRIIYTRSYWFPRGCVSRDVRKAKRRGLKNINTETDS